MGKTEYDKEKKRAQRACGYLNTLLAESLPQHNPSYEVTCKRVDEYINTTLGPPHSKN